MRALLATALVVLSCGPTDGAKLYATQPIAPSLTAASIQALEHMGPTVIDKGINFAIYSARAERVELYLFDDPEATRPTRAFQMSRFGDVWNLYVEGVGLGQHYGYIAFGPNFPYDPEWKPGLLKGFKSDLDADGNRFNPNKLLIDPYAKALHRKHDWGKGSIATGPKRAESTVAAASKGVVVQSKYTWSDNEATWRTLRQDPNMPGHKANDVILYELHVKGFTASAASGVAHPGTYRGLGEKAEYLKDLGVTGVHLMPVQEKPSEGGYWGYQTLNFFTPERSYAFAQNREEIVDEFKWMVDQLHQRGIEVWLDVVYNHTGEGGLWRELLEFDFNPDPSITTIGLVNFDPKEVAGLYSFRGLDNHAYYGLTPDRQSYWNNAGVGNQTRPNHAPFRRLVLDSLRYWVEEFHVDGFRFDLAPVLGEKDDLYYVWDDPKNTVLQDIIDDPLLQKYNTRFVAEPWAAGGYDLSKSFNGPGNNNFANGFGTRVGLFPSSTSTPGYGWAEWNGRFRDWWRSFFNNDNFKLNSTEVRDCGFFMTGSYDWFNWNQRRPYHSMNFVTVHDGFPMYDLTSYSMKQNGCGPLNPVCCSEPLSAWCEKVSGEDNNRSRDWGQANEAVKRQIMRDWYVAMMVSHGTPLLYAGDEWMRTQLGNNNAYSNGADNSFNWLDWGTYQSNDERNRMHDFVRSLIRLRKEHAYAFAPEAYGTSAPFAWKSTSNTDAVNWGGKALMQHYYDATKGPELVILLNGEATQTEFTLPAGRNWFRLVDTQQYFDLPDTLRMQQLPTKTSNNVWLDNPERVPGASYGVPARSIVILEAR